jgi:hypothetical protein
MDSDVPEPIQDIVEPFDEVEYFECDVDLVNVQSLGIELTFTDFHYFNNVDGDAAFYPCPESKYSSEEVEGKHEGVLMYAQGVGWYCGHDLGGVGIVEEWFQEGLEEFLSSDIRFTAFDE